MKRSPADWIRKIQGVLTPDLLKAEYIHLNSQNPLYGHCYAATEALYHLLGGAQSEWHPCRGRDVDGVTHWWLANKEGQILDPTAEQYTSLGKTPPYDKGSRGPFLTQQPSKRARTIICRVEKLP